MTTSSMLEGRRADSARRRQPVSTAISEAAASCGELSVASVARRAGVDRTFLYRHRDLLAQLHAAAIQAAACPPGSAPVTAASLQADLAAAQDRSARQTTRIRQLERKLAELLGQQAWQESGLGAPHDIEQLQRRITELEQSVVDLTCQLRHRDDELAAARAANREMIAQINRTPERL